MKFLILFSTLILTLSPSCEKREENKEIEINYSAQTRGFKYVLHLKNNILKIDKNNIIKEITLNKSQCSNIDNLVNNINFNDIENNISIDELAVDRAIKGIFIIKLKEKEYQFEFNHQKLPVTIKTLINQLEEFLS
ncbi:hypothetical protein [Lutibacter sp.]|uniref:hypothetical protein n=1 Tax=Lutibacter sp. TaxID=1925666 RepID=UPI00349FF6FD